MKNLKKNRLFWVFLILSVLFIVIGVWRGEPNTVYQKASNICMECIGLG